LWLHLQAQQIYAIFECLAHNPRLFFELHLDVSKGLRDEHAQKQQQGRSEPVTWANAALAILKVTRNFINAALQRANQRT
jgi:hypothetical protein